MNLKRISPALGVLRPTSEGTVAHSVTVRSVPSKVARTVEVLMPFSSRPVKMPKVTTSLASRISDRGMGAWS